MAGKAHHIPMSLKPVYTAWITFGKFIGTYVMTPLIMFALFFALFVPVGLVLRLLGKDLLALKMDSEAESYRAPISKPPAKNFEKPF